MFVSSQKSLIMPHRSYPQRPTTFVATHPHDSHTTRGATIPDWQRAQRRALMERKLGDRFPLPAPTMAARASKPGETHALCPTSASQVSLDFCKSPWEPSMGGLRAPAVIPSPIPSPKPLYPSKNALEAHSLFTSLPAQAVILSAAKARPRGPKRRALWPSPHLLVGPRREAGLHAYWAMDHVSLEKPVKGEGGILSYWALFTIRQSDIRRRPPSRLFDWRNVFPGRTRRAGFRVRWKEGAGREAEAGEL